MTSDLEAPCSCGQSSCRNALSQLISFQTDCLTQINSLQPKLEAAQTELFDTVKKLSDTQDHVIQLKQDLSDTKLELALSRNEIDQLKQQVSDLQSQNQYKDQVIAVQRQQVQDQLKELEEQDSQLSVVTTDYSKLMENFNKLNTYTDSVVEDLTQLTSLHESQTTKSSELEAQLCVLQKFNSLIGFQIERLDDGFGLCFSGEEESLLCCSIQSLPHDSPLPPEPGDWLLYSVKSVDEDSAGRLGPFAHSGLVVRSGDFNRLILSLLDAVIVGDCQSNKD
ncbi:hypothetical protein P9112_002484 [Eukaryota sp. TZLM1-RC]